MSLSQIFKKVLIPCAAGVTSAESHTFGPNCDKKPEQGTRPSDLPIYSKPCPVCGDGRDSASSPSGIEETVGNIRRELWVWQDSLRGYRHKIVDVYRKGFSKGDSIIEYLREEPHGPQRIGAIGISGVAGYILGMRRGVARRVFYGACGALGMAAICYPNEAMDALESVVLEGRRCFIVAYHFIYGETPKLPEWLEKFTGITNPPEQQPKQPEKQQQKQPEKQQPKQPEKLQQQQQKPGKPVPDQTRETDLDLLKIMGIDEKNHPMKEKRS